MSAPFSRIFKSFIGSTRVCEGLEPRKGGGTRTRKRKRKIDQLDVTDSEEQPKQKPRKISDHHLRSSMIPSFGLNSVNLDRILYWLSNNDITSVGIYGMGGIGKTTLAKNVYSWVLKHGIPSVDVVAWINVGMHFTLVQLQNNIADQLGFDLQNDKDEIRRAGILHSLLSRAGNCVLILDDLWDDFRLELVGIPKHCKLVITSRSLDVCRRMRCQKVLKVEPLPQEEAWQLFLHSIKDATMGKIELKHIAELVCRKCAGVPSAITKLAKSMRGVIDASRWTQALCEIDRFSCPPNMKDLFSVLKLSYANLSDVTLQRCFLYCALYPEDYAINKEELIRLWIAEMFIDDVLSLQPQYDKGHSIVNKLLNSSLLEPFEDKVKMHDLIRDMAIAIAKDSCMVKAGAGLTKLPIELERQEDLHAVSLMMNSVSNIPLDASPKCPNLSTLHLQHNPIQAIPDSFFSTMRALHVLNLSHTSIERLPSSISDLEELRLLDLSFCRNLKQLSSLDKLQKLRFLDLSHTVIEQFPYSLGMLIMLTELNLSSIPTLEKLPGGVLPALSRLKRLTCDVVGSISELQNLRSLEILDARFIDIGELSSYVRSQHWRTLECFHLQVGHNIRPKLRCSRGVSLYGCSLTGKEGEFLVLPDNIQELYIDDCRDFSSLSDIMNSVDVCNYRNCRSCSNSNCVGTTNCKGEDGFKQRARFFSSLEICTISRCHDIEKVFPPGLMQDLQCLELIEIEDCQQLKELIAEEVGEDSYSEGNSAVVSLPQLKRLVLTLLPQLNSIYKGLVVCASLQSLTLTDCPKLNRLPFSFCADDQNKVTLYS